VYIQHGTQVGCPDFDGDILDEDIYDDHKYKMDCGNGDGVFVIDKHTGCISVRLILFHILYMPYSCIGQFWGIQ
jgi:hypothetical protein